MKMKRMFFTLVLITLALAACAQDPWRADQIKAQAEADRMAAQSAQEAANQEQERQHKQVLNQIVEQQAALDEQLAAQRKIVAEQAKRLQIQIAIYVLGPLLILCVGVWMVMTTRTAVQQTTQVLIPALALAAAHKADIASRLIPLDRVTGNYPLLVEGEPGRYLADANTHTSLPTHAHVIGNSQMIDGAMNSRHTYVLASQASKSDKPEGITVIDAPRQYEPIDVSNDTQRAGDDESVEDFIKRTFGENDDSKQ